MVEGESALSISNSDVDPPPWTSDTEGGTDDFESKRLSGLMKLKMGDLLPIYY